jgi:hypothetical protein
LFERRGAQQRPLEKFQQALALGLGESARLSPAWPRNRPPNPPAAAFPAPPADPPIRADQQKIPVIRDQHQPVFRPNIC